MAETKLLIVEDEPVIALDIKQRLTRLGYQVVAIAKTSRAALENVVQLQPDLVLMDILLQEGSSGIEAAAQIREQFNIPVVFLTAHADKATIEQAKATQPFGYVVKPFETHDLRTAVEIALSRYQTENAIQTQAQTQLEELRNSIAFSLPHEFRTPLTGILTGVELLRLRAQSLKPDEILELTNPILRSTQRLSKLVQSFLFYAQLEITASDPEQMNALRVFKTCDPQFWIADTAIQVAQQAQRNADLQLDLHNATIAIADFRLQRIVQELVDNAFKFSEPGTPVHIVSAAEKSGFTIDVIDQGRGMTTEQITHIGGYMQFDRRLHEQQGSGLGLTIAKRLLELHGGKLAIESIPGQKTTVRAVFPLSRGEQMEDTETGERRNPGTRF